MGRMSRNKGKAGEREAAKEISRLFGVDARRGVQFAGGTDSPDVVHGLPDVHVEVKRTERLSLWAAIDQAVSDAGTKMPIVLHRANRRPWIAVLRLDDLPTLVEKLGAGEAAAKGEGDV